MVTKKELEPLKASLKSLLTEQGEHEQNMRNLVFSCIKLCLKDEEQLEAVQLLNDLKLAVEKKYWYEGGTLHKATFGQFLKGTQENQMATLADFVRALADDHETYKPAIAYETPNQLLVNYVLPLMAGLNEMGGAEDHHDLAVEYPVIFLSHQLGFIKNNPHKQNRKARRK